MELVQNAKQTSDWLLESATNHAGSLANSVPVIQQNAHHVLEVILSIQILNPVIQMFRAMPTHLAPAALSDMFFSHSIATFVREEPIAQFVTVPIQTSASDVSKDTFWIRTLSVKFVQRDAHNVTTVCTVDSVLLVILYQVIPVSRHV